MERYDVAKSNPTGEDKTVDVISRTLNWDNSVQLENERKLNRRCRMLTRTERCKIKGHQLKVFIRNEADKSIKSQSDRMKDKMQVASVQTRTQKQTEIRALKPLKVKKVEALDVSCEEFKQMQKDDENLNKYFKLAAE